MLPAQTENSISTTFLVSPGSETTTMLPVYDTFDAGPSFTVLGEEVVGAGLHDVVSASETGAGFQIDTKAAEMIGDPGTVTTIEAAESMISDVATLPEQVADPDVDNSTSIADDFFEGGKQLYQERNGVQSVESTGAVTDQVSSDPNAQTDNSPETGASQDDEVDSSANTSNNVESDDNQPNKDEVDEVDSGEPAEQTLESHTGNLSETTAGLPAEGSRDTLQAIAQERNELMDFLTTKQKELAIKNRELGVVEVTLTSLKAQRDRLQSQQTVNSDGAPNTNQANLVAELQIKINQFESKKAKIEAKIQQIESDIQTAQTRLTELAQNEQEILQKQTEQSQGLETLMGLLSKAGIAQEEQKKVELELKGSNTQAIATIIFFLLSLLGKTSESK